ncbi:MAG TPA: sugar-binding protein, partial [Ignavibacteriaceae bacterium]
MKKLLYFSIQILLCLNRLYGESDSLSIRNNDVVIQALRLIEPIEIDGRVDEQVWSNTNDFNNFIQRDPNEGASPTERTTIKLAYDENYLYLAAIMYDSSPDSIISR